MTIADELHFALRKKNKQADELRFALRKKIDSLKSGSIKNKLFEFFKLDKLDKIVTFVDEKILDSSHDPRMRTAGDFVSLIKIKLIMRKLKKMEKEQMKIEEKLEKTKEHEKFD